MFFIIWKRKICSLWPKAYASFLHRKASSKFQQIRRNLREECEASRPALLLPLISRPHTSAIIAVTIASSGLKCEIGPVSSVTKRPVRIWSHLLEKRALTCEGFVRQSYEGTLGQNQLEFSKRWKSEDIRASAFPSRAHSSLVFEKLRPKCSRCLLSGQVTPGVFCLSIKSDTPELGICFAIS